MTYERGMANNERQQDAYFDRQLRSGRDCFVRLRRTSSVHLLILSRGFHVNFCVWRMRIREGAKGSAVRLLSEVLFYKYTIKFKRKKTGGSSQQCRGVIVLKCNMHLFGQRHNIVTTFTTPKNVSRNTNWAKRVCASVPNF